MTRRLRLWLALGVLAVLGAGLVWALETFGEESVRLIVMRELEAAAPGELTIGSFEVSLIPPEVTLAEIEFRSSSEETRATVAAVALRVALWTSLWEGTWIADVMVDRLHLVTRDSDPLWKEFSDESGLGSLESPEEPVFAPRLLGIRSAQIELESVADGTFVKLENILVRGERTGVLDPRFSFEIVSRGAIARAGRLLALQRVVVEGEVRAGRLQLDRVLADGDSGSLRGSGAIENGGLQANAEWDVQLEPLFSILPEAGRIAGSGTIVATIGGSVEAPEIDANLVARSVRIDDVVFSGEGRLRSKGPDWQLTSPRTEMFGGTVEGEATGRFAARIPYVVRGRFHDWDPATFLMLFDLEAPIRGGWSGEATLRGYLLGEDEMSGAGTISLAEGAEELQGKASFRIREDSAEIQGTLEGRADGRLSCRYETRSGQISGEVTVAGDDLSSFGRFLDLDLAGSGRIDARFTGTDDEPGLSGTADFSSIVLRGSGLGQVAGGFAVSPTGLRLEDARFFDGTLLIRGGVALVAGQENDWRAEAREASIERLVAAARTWSPGIPAMRGSISGQVDWKGTWADGRVNGAWRAEHWTFPGAPAGELSGKLSTAAQAWRSDLGFAGEGGLRAAATIRISSDGSLGGDLSISEGRLENVEAVRSRWPSLTGGFRGDGRIGGSLDRPSVDGSMTFTRLEVSGRGIDDARLVIRLDDEQLTVDGGAKGLWTLVGSSTLQAPFPFEAHLTWDGFELAPWIASTVARLSIRSAGEARLLGDLRQPLGEGVVRVKSFVIVREPLRLSSPRTITIGIRDGAIDLTETTLEGANEKVMVRARLDPTSSEFHVRGTANLVLLEAIPGIASARGELDLEIHGSRQRSDPWTFLGTSEVREGAMDVGFLLGVTDLSGKIRFDGRRADLRDVNGRLGGGGFFAEGTLSFDEGWNLGWALRDANLGFPDWLDYRASGHGRLLGPIARPKLRGEIELTQAVYDRRIDWADFLPWFRREAQRSVRNGELPVELDLHLFADGGIFVDNNLVEAEFQGSFEARGSRENLILSGRVDVLSGDFTFRRRRFDITVGSVQFRPDRPMNPDLEFRGETTVVTNDGDYEISVHVGGSAERPRIEFTADDPALTENDILALVTFGRTVSQLQGQGAGIELTEVLALTAGPNAAGVEDRIHDLLPVDRIEFQPSFSRTTGATEPRLSIGKDLTEGFRALLSTGLGSERQQDVALEYQLTPRVSVQGVWESQTKSQAGAFGGDVKFRIPFRTFAEFSLFPSRPGIDP